MKKIGLLLVLAIMVYAGTSAQKKTIYINHEMGNCTGVAPGKCLEYRYKTSGPWLLLHGGIKGFTYQPGNMYKLLIRETKVKNPPADGISIKRTLIKILSKEAMMSIALPHESISGKWVISGIYTEDKKEDVTTKNFLIDFNEEAKKITGKVCNGFSGSLSTQKGNKLTIGQLMSTKMFCPEMEFENRIMTALQKANSYGFDNDTLVLTIDGQKLLALILQKQTPGVQTDTTKKPATELKDGINSVPWYFTSYSFENNTVDISKLGSFILFNGNEQKVTGHAPCNNFFGTAIVEVVNDKNGKLKLNKIGATMMACENLSTEQIIMKLLAMVDSYEISGHSLALKVVGKTVLQLTDQK